jgi:hypothetical protein
VSFTDEQAAILNADGRIGLPRVAMPPEGTEVEHSDC